MFQVAQTLTPQEIEQIIKDAPIDDQIKELLLKEVPSLVDFVHQGVERITSPSNIWLESIQFADYTQQFGQHLMECGDPDCTERSGRALVEMSTSFKLMAEAAMQALDEMEKDNGA